MMVEVVNGDIAKAVRVLKYRLSKDEILQEAKRREHHLSKSERRKQKNTVALKRKLKHRAVKTWKPSEKKKHGKH